MVITNRKIDKIDIFVKICDEQLELLEKMKLWVILDKGLKLNEHLDYVCKKMGKKYGFMCRANKKLTTESKILLYKSIIAPHIEYFSTLLYIMNDEQIKRMQKIQNKIIRLIKNKPMAPKILERGIPICGLRPNHVCEVSRCLFQLRMWSFETWFIFYKTGLSIQC
jgi:hypothetical protein